MKIRSKFFNDSRSLGEYINENNISRSDIQSIVAVTMLDSDNLIDWGLVLFWWVNII